MCTLYNELREKRKQTESSEKIIFLIITQDPSVRI